MPLIGYEAFAILPQDKQKVYLSAESVKGFFEELGYRWSPALECPYRGQNDKLKSLANNVVQDFRPANIAHLKVRTTSKW